MNGDMWVHPIQYIVNFNQVMNLIWFYSKMHPLNFSCKCKTKGATTWFWGSIDFGVKRLKVNVIVTVIFDLLLKNFNITWPWLKVSHSYRIWDVFAQPEVASELRRTSHFVTSDVSSYPLRYFNIHNPRLSEQVIWSMSDLSLLQLLVPMKTKVEIPRSRDIKTEPKTDRRRWDWMHNIFCETA